MYLVIDSNSRGHSISSSCNRRTTCWTKRQHVITQFVLQVSDLIIYSNTMRWDGIGGSCGLFGFDRSVLKLGRLRCRYRSLLSRARATSLAGWSVFLQVRSQGFGYIAAEIMHTYTTAQYVYVDINVSWITIIIPNQLIIALCYVSGKTNTSDYFNKEKETGLW